MTLFGNTGHDPPLGSNSTILGKEGPMTARGQYTRRFLTIDLHRTFRVSVLSETNNHDEKGVVRRAESSLHQTPLCSDAQFAD